MIDAEKILEATNLIDKGAAILSGGPLSYYLRELCAAHAYLLKNHCPFQVGSRVMLAKTPHITIEETWGWMASKHFLVKGAIGTVRDASFSSRSNDFTFGIEFDDESWIDREGIRQEVSRKHTYGFKLSDLSAPGAAIGEKE